MNTGIAYRQAAASALATPIDPPFAALQHIRPIQSNPINPLPATLQYRSPLLIAVLIATSFAKVSIHLAPPRRDCAKLGVFYTPKAKRRKIRSLARALLVQARTPTWTSASLASYRSAPSSLTQLFARSALSSRTGQYPARC